MFKAGIRGMIWTLFFLSLGGFLIHFRIHTNPPDKGFQGTFYWIPVLFAIINVIFLPIFFSFRKTVPLAYLINVITVIIGIVLMLHFSIIDWTHPVNWYTVLFYSTIADCVILLARLAPGHYILRWYFPKDKQNGKKGGKA
ncbi:MAG: hypothetical protein ACLFUS_08295 [Candidatus Sumerlaeia bacterium]